jgi:hypothetical protein
MDNLKETEIFAAIYVLPSRLWKIRENARLIQEQCNSIVDLSSDDNAKQHALYIQELATHIIADIERPVEITD